MAGVNYFFRPAVLIVAGQAVMQDGVIDQNILAPTEVEQLIAATAPDHRYAVRFLFMSGARFGELCGLMWTDMDWASGRVIVRRQRSAMNGELSAPKTLAGTRWIDLPAGLIVELKAHRLRIPGEFMFPVDERNFRSRVWHPALRRAGLRSIRIHDARHTHASLLIGSGADIVAVSRRLGHSNPTITLSTYSHAFVRRSTDGLGEQLATFMRLETVGCDLVASGKNDVVPRSTDERNVNEISMPFRAHGYGHMGKVVSRGQRNASANLSSRGDRHESRTTPVI